MNKRLCILQVTPSTPTQSHVELFGNKEQCDFYFVTHDKPHKEALEYCPNTTWTDTRNVLIEKVPKKYDYYGFADYDYGFRPLGTLGALEQVLYDLDKFNPAVLTYYPGRGMITPFADNIDYRNSKEYSVLPFAHAGFKMIHHSLLDWFFPMITQYGGGVEACHLFNILEIPFLKNTVCSHKMVYDNGHTNMESPHNRDSYKNQYNMHMMWNWLRPSIKRTKIIDYYAKTEKEKADPMLIKRAFIDIVIQQNIQPVESEKTVNYYDINKISTFFNPTHEWFVQKLNK
tara:strand:+ start:5890 stop:6750 length:861 start_codon:yes stop_codon:yes gene_type:complete